MFSSEKALRGLHEKNKQFFFLFYIYTHIAVGSSSCVYMLINETILKIFTEHGERILYFFLGAVKTVV